ncbi:unnamed protein product [Clonostachys solani]|uniref:Uncharacterized protein n=1 Tax=Clonostachys solani TaxID=160281 RepID=A0A9P0EGC9_9HYPO|nr:unnamed protein product [Clonostachys solani]
MQIIPKRHRIGIGKKSVYEILAPLRGKGIDRRNAFGHQEGAVGYEKFNQLERRFVVEGLISSFEGMPWGFDSKEAKMKWIERCDAKRPAVAVEIQGRRVDVDVFF